ncbi:protein trichome birefringence-like 39 [Cryptomeria japonica]|uniref:protein trichome birefringence-like 39 n=1 Tax=Cryptomeria japonica TaxID=3369 RepID=UPI0027DA7048|nr:protein trichome birefringence-like 39 [Cryptomeria japonica]
MLIAILTLVLCLLSLHHTNCNIFSGRWVHHPSYPLYDALKSPYIVKPFNCKPNRRPDSDYQEWRWQPNGCDIPRFSARGLLEKLRGKKLRFVGDSISQNQFLSLICLVSKEFPTTFIPSSYKNDKFISTVCRLMDSKVFIAVKYHAQSVGILSREFPQIKNLDCRSPPFKENHLPLKPQIVGISEDNCFLHRVLSIEFFWAPFLVDLEINHERKRIVHVDEIQNNSVHWRADIFIFESSKWWRENLGKQRWDIIMEGQKIYTDMKPLVAYKKALITWSHWVSSNVNPQTLVFFRSNSYSHYNRKRRCASEKEPIEDPSYNPHPTVYAAILHQVLSTTKFPVKFFNASLNSAFRKDGHPSIYTSLNISAPEHQDCTHWCLPGVPDSWNQLFYATLLGA